MDNKSRIYFYAAFCALLLSVLLPPAVLTLKTTKLPVFIYCWQRSANRSTLDPLPK